MGTRLGNWLLPHEVSGGSIGIPLGNIGGKFGAHQLSLELFSRRGTDPKNIGPEPSSWGDFGGSPCNLPSHYRELWKIAPPRKNLPFDEKIEHVLRAANQPSYRSAAPDTLEMLLNLYRARNSMHEGDCYFRDRNGDLKKISKISQVRPFISAVQDFIVWIDARA